MDTATIVRFSNEAEKYAGAMLEYAQQYGVTGPHQWAAFLAQTAHESGDFRFTQELWGPTPAQREYARRWFNKDPRARQYAQAAGEDDVGKFYRGHGLIQITGFMNHLEYSQDTYGDERCAEKPDMLAELPDCVRSALWFWKRSGMPSLALVTQDDFRECTRRINGGMNGWEDRLAKWERAKELLGP